MSDFKVGDKVVWKGNECVFLGTHPENELYPWSLVGSDKQISNGGVYSFGEFNRYGEQDCANVVLKASGLAAVYGAWVMSLDELQLVGKAAPSTPATRQEAPCRCCSRPNDVGVKTCWCCGNAP